MLFFLKGELSAAAMTVPFWNLKSPPFLCQQFFFEEALLFFLSFLIVLMLQCCFTCPRFWTFDQKPFFVMGECSDDIKSILPSLLIVDDGFLHGINSILLSQPIVHESFFARLRSFFLSKGRVASGCHHCAFRNHWSPSVVYFFVPRKHFYVRLASFFFFSESMNKVLEDSSFSCSGCLFLRENFIHVLCVGIFPLWKCATLTGKKHLGIRAEVTQRFGKDFWKWGVFNGGRLCQEEV